MGRQKSTHVDDPHLVGSRLRAARRQSALTLRQLAFPGCSAAYISHLEHGQRTPSLQVLVELARRLGVAVEYLAWGVDEETDSSRGPTAVFSVAAYQEAVAQAPTTWARVWALSGLAQAAATEGNDELVVLALKQALAELEERGHRRAAANRRSLRGAGRSTSDAPSPSARFESSPPNGGT